MNILSTYLHYLLSNNNKKKDQFYKLDTGFA